MIAKSWLSRCWWLGRYFLAIGGAITFVGDCAFAQSKIVPDSTLGKESSVVIPNSNNLPVEVIRGGAKRGANLFQSFQEFNVLEGGRAYFYSPSADIQNIVARVTGSHHSEILGTLGTIGNSNPNLFLINPNGIIFGPNASLNIGASFIATTANAIKFGNQGVFNASAPNVPPLLTVNPSAFLFNQIAQPITNLSPEGLHIPEGQSFLLLGGNVSFDGAVVVAPGGRVELGGLAGAGTVGLNVDGSDLHLIFPEGVTRADVSLRNGARVDVSAGGGGNLAINARNLDVLEGSELRAGIGSRLGSVDSKAGDIEINAAGTITLNDGSFISNVVSMSAVGKGGNVNITAGSLSMSNGALVNTNTFGQGNSGEIHIQAGSLSLTDGSQLRADTAGQGNAGSISVRVGGAISLVGDDSAIYSLVEPRGSGNGGNIDILAGSLSLQGNLSSAKIAQISNSTYGGGVASLRDDMQFFAKF
ncbi:MAG: filamentous hemagglutinin N-terminal domain-containing protein [Stigonema ocellatum SAG 48.90 = DSM 106950]|nr:filamentous hemagglutinin N-terminal domain-containing protein [Stigonema ocellatum SAG 48.90 = DSM 106950]